MINPFKYTPVINTYHYKKPWFNHVSPKKVKYAPWVQLIDNNTFDKIQRFTKPVESMEEYNIARIDIEAEMFGKLDMIKTGSLDVIKANHLIELNSNVSDKYVKILEKVQREWKERLDAGGGYMLFQYMAKIGIFGKEWRREVQECPNEVTGDAPEYAPRKISYFRYFFIELPKYFAALLWCGLVNFKNRKEIQKSEKEIRDALGKSLNVGK